jgi:hypothetical protein
VLKFEVLVGKSNEYYGNPITKCMKSNESCINYPFLLWKCNDQIHREWFGNPMTKSIKSGLENPMTKLSKFKDSFENLDIEFVFRSKIVWLFYFFGMIEGMAKFMATIKIIGNDVLMETQ